MLNPKKYIKLDFVVDIKNYKESFNKWLKIRDALLQPQDRDPCEESFNTYLHVIKPVIHHFDQLTTTLPESQYGFFSEELTAQQIDLLKNVFESLRKYEIVTETFLQANAPYLVLSEQESNKLLVQKYQPIYRIDLTQDPKNGELQWWGNGLNVQEVCFQGKVVPGKGEGRKNLGMPTANLEIQGETEQKLINFPNGVYLVDFEFVGGNTYRGAGCLGTNPHYQNFQEKRRVEVYVIHDFGEQQFYDVNVKVTMKRLIRFEGKFKSFDEFLQAMHNDIFTAKHYKPKEIIEEMAKL